MLTEKEKENFVENNQLDASIIQNLFCHTTLHVSGIFCAHHQELPAVSTAIGTFHACMKHPEKIIDEIRE
jgi:hypothetical protein